MAYSWKKQASAAYGYSLARLSLQAYMYVEDIPRYYEGAREKQKTTDKRFMELLSAYRNGELTEECLCSFRDSLRFWMETVIAYTDCFLIYEHAWNRLERRFDTDIKPTGISDEDMVDILMDYLTSDRDAAIVNRRIQQIIGQLPVRFTRQKYYGMVRSALTSYIGADKEGLRNEMYLLRTASMAELDDGHRDSEPEFRDLFAALQAVSMRDATTEQYRDVQAKLHLASERLFADSEYLQMMQEMVNDLYVLLLTQEEATIDEAMAEHACRILDGLLAAYRSGDLVISEEITEELSSLEGVQEEFFEAYSRLEPVPEPHSPEPVSGTHSRDSVSAVFTGRSQDLAKGKKIERLLSSSSYASLEDEGSPELVSSQDAEAAANDYILGIEPVFAACQKPVMRAIMATALSILPVCFNSLDEIRSYIAGSLGSCADFAEKEASKELLMQIMEMDGYDAMV